MRNQLTLAWHLKTTGRTPYANVRLILALLLFHGLMLPARALIGLPYQMQLGNPSGAIADTNNHEHYLIQRPVLAEDYNDTLRVPNWVSWDLTDSDVGSSGRGSFLTDTNLPGNFYWVKTGDYTYSGYDRGHLCPSADRTDSTTNNDQVFYMSNILPQAPDNNQGVWAALETYCRTLAAAGNELLILCGPQGFTGARINTNGPVFIPTNVWKIIVVVTNGPGLAVERITPATRVIAVNIPNIAGVRTTPWTNFLVSVNQLQTNTGYTFLTALPAYTASVLRAKVDGQPTPVIQPTLTSGFTNGADLVLSWPADASGFVLQENTSLSPTTWTLYPGPLATNGNTVYAILPTTSLNNFFRLKHP
jgi:DNA/RNA endonuclease G (NUC1)